MEGVGDEVIAEHYCRFVAPEVADGGSPAADLGFIEHIIVNEGGHVYELDDGGDDAVLLGEAAGGWVAVGGSEAGEEHERGAEHFAAIALDVDAKAVDGREIAGELAVEDDRDLFELPCEQIGDGLVYGREIQHSRIVGGFGSAGA